MRKTRAFTLIELMVVILVVGILVAVSIPAYNSYNVRARMAEAYLTCGTIGKSQVTYFVDHNEFFPLAFTQPTFLDPPMMMQNNPSWTAFGYPASVGSNLNFQYKTYAGRIDDSGTEVTGMSASGNSFNTLSTPNVIQARYSDGVVCNASPTTPLMLGAVAQPNYDWIVIAAVGDLDYDRGDDCTAVVKFLEASALTNRKPSISGGFIIFNEGK